MRQLLTRFFKLKLLNLPLFLLEFEYSLTQKFHENNKRTTL